MNAAAPASPYKHFSEPQRNVLLNISHSSCTCNDDHVGLLIKTERIQIEKTIKLPFVIFKRERWGRCNIVKTDGVAVMVIAFDS